MLSVLRDLFAGRDTEALVVLLLNAKNSVIGANVVYTGNVSASLVSMAALQFRGLRRSLAALALSGLIDRHTRWDPSGGTPRSFRLSPTTLNPVGAEAPDAGL
jgi:hypothetical protein